MKFIKDTIKEIIFVAVIAMGLFGPVALFSKVWTSVFCSFMSTALKLPTIDEIDVNELDINEQLS